LRERPEDILPLAELLLREVCRELKRPSLTLSPRAQESLVAAPWPGNVRQLRNVLERGAILCEGTLLTELEVPGVAVDDRAPLAMEGVERDAIARALAASQGNRRRAAQALGIGLRTLYEKLKRYGLS
jgi:two-component system response regulator FlrC